MAGWWCPSAGPVTLWSPEISTVPGPDLLPMPLEGVVWGYHRGVCRRYWWSWWDETCWGSPKVCGYLPYELGQEDAPEGERKWDMYRERVRYDSQIQREGVGYLTGYSACVACLVFLEALHNPIHNAIMTHYDTLWHTMTHYDIMTHYDTSTPTYYALTGSGFLELLPPRKPASVWALPRCSGTGGGGSSWLERERERERERETIIKSTPAMLTHTAMNLCWQSVFSQSSQKEGVASVRRTTSSLSPLVPGSSLGHMLSRHYDHHIWRGILGVAFPSLRVVPSYFQDTPRCGRPLLQYIFFPRKTPDTLPHSHMLTLSFTHTHSLSWTHTSSSISFLRRGIEAL